MGLFDWLKFPKKPKIQLENWKVAAIRLQTKNLSESVEIVNTSSDYDSAVTAFDAACTALRFLSDFTDDEIRAAGCSLNKSPAPYLSYLLENKDELLEKVRFRSHSFSYTHQKDTKPKIAESQEQSYTVDYYENQPLYGYLSASARACEACGDVEKLRQLEKLLPGFASFVKSSFETDGDLPPVVAVRDTSPKLYMRYGEWRKAEDVIRLCISCGAYGYTEYRNSRDHKGHWVSEPEVGEGDLMFLQQCQKAAEAAIAYLAENPGMLQSQIYKVPALSEVDHDALVWFCRNSHQLRKERDGKTNRLYVAEVSK